MGHCRFGRQARPHSNRTGSRLGKGGGWAPQLRLKPHARFVEEWCRVGAIILERLFRQITKCAATTGDRFSAQAVYDIVLEHARRVDPDVRPHDLRRSFARLAQEGHAAIEQLSMTLGHASIATTERYVSAKQNFRSAPCDVLDLDISQPECSRAMAKTTQE